MNRHLHDNIINPGDLRTTIHVDLASVQQWLLHKSVSNQISTSDNQVILGGSSPRQGIKTFMANVERKIKEALHTGTCCVGP